MLDTEDHEPPEALEYLLTWYNDIRGRAARGMHYEPVLLSEIGWYEHFLAKAGIEMTAFDWDVIFRLDQVWQQSVPKTDSDAPTPPEAPTQH